MSQEYSSDEFTNRLSKEKSPYLLQHAHNPVNWYPWGEEAFLEASKQDKPIFLSIGYATCHWCHVMEEESFQDQEVAAVLNEAFICVKVDREELPEIDSLYMEFAQTMIVGSAGWPLNLILTPDLKPFYAATYMPKVSSKGLVGVIELTEKIAALWQSGDREHLTLQAEKIVDILKAHKHVAGDELPTQAPIVTTADILYKIADPVYGGMKGAPKFPLGYQPSFLLRYFQKTQDARALFLVEKTLEMMHRGGIFDHLGGGFHRYAVDEHWHIPHFEKMLYDNALLAYGYLDAWKVTHRPVYQAVCIEVLEYLLRDMKQENGGFYSAEDADSQGLEGFFYTWTRNEVISLLGEDNGTLFCDLYGVFEPGILEDRSVLCMGMSLQDYAQMRDLDPKELQNTLQQAKKTLFEARKLRPRPFRDNKIITCWNGLAIHAFVSAGFSLQNDTYIQAALDAANFIQRQLYKDGVLYRRYCDGQAKFRASLSDYAFLIRGLLSLFESGKGTNWLTWAIALTKRLEEKFKNDQGAFYQSDPDEEHLLIRKCHYSDGAEPSGNAVHTENLLRLWQITFNDHFLSQAEDGMRAVTRFLDVYPLGYCYHLIALQRYFDDKKATCVIALNKNGQWREEIQRAVSKVSSSHHVFIWQEFGDEVLKEQLGAKYSPIDEKTALYVCRRGVCQKPLNDLEAICHYIKEHL